MSFMVPKCAAPGFEIENVKEDQKSAKRVGQYKVSKKAIYIPTLPGSEYIPFAAVEEIFARSTDLPVIGCCGKCLPVKKVFITVNGKRRDFVMDPPKDADYVMECYNEWKSIQQ